MKITHIVSQSNCLLMLFLLTITQITMPMYHLYAKKAALVAGIGGVAIVGAHQERLCDAFHVIECITKDENEEHSSVLSRLTTLKPVLVGKKALHYAVVTSHGDPSKTESRIYLDRGDGHLNNGEKLNSPFRGGIIVGRSKYHKRCVTFAFERDEHYSLVPVIKDVLERGRRSALISNELEALTLLTRHFGRDPKVIVEISPHQQARA